MMPENFVVIRRINDRDSFFSLRANHKAFWRCGICQIRKAQKSGENESIHDE
jgi:hypothetical protein